MNLNITIKQIQTMPIAMLRQTHSQIGNEILKLRRYLQANVLAEEEENKTLKQLVQLENLRSVCIGEINDRR